MKALVEAQLYRDAGAVTRYHAKRMHRTQTIAEHTFGMLMLVKQVARGHGEFGLQSLALMYHAILHHDLPELFTGDVPAPIKRAHPELGPLLDSIEAGLSPLYEEANLIGEESVLVKWADRMELVLWCLEEYRMGNTYTKDTISKGLGWIMAGRMPHCAAEFTMEVVNEAAALGIVPASGAELEMTR